jgi:hypothetical protein
MVTQSNPQAVPTKIKATPLKTFMSRPSNGVRSQSLLSRRFHSIPHFRGVTVAQCICARPLVTRTKRQPWPTMRYFEPPAAMKVRQRAPFGSASAFAGASNATRKSSTVRRTLLQVSDGAALLHKGWLRSAAPAGRPAFRSLPLRGRQPLGG